MPYSRGCMIVKGSLIRCVRCDVIFDLVQFFLHILWNCSVFQNTVFTVPIPLHVYFFHEDVWFIGGGIGLCILNLSSRCGLGTSFILHLLYLQRKNISYQLHKSLAKSCSEQQ